MLLLLFQIFVNPLYDTIVIISVRDTTPLLLLLLPFLNTFKIIADYFVYYYRFLLIVLCSFNVRNTRPLLIPLLPMFEGPYDNAIVIIAVANKPHKLYLDSKMSLP